MADSTSPPHPRSLTPRNADMASLLLRAALAGIFIYHGVDKIFSPGNAWGTNWVNPWVYSMFNAPSAASEPPTWWFAAMQALVPWGELLGGVALFLGLLTRPAALALMIVQAVVVALVVMHPQFAFDRRGGIEYNLVIIAGCLALAVLVAGRLSLDELLLRAPRRAPRTPMREPLAAGTGQ
jgi:putative oxidoreductase